MDNSIVSGRLSLIEDFFEILVKHFVLKRVNKLNRHTFLRSKIRRMDGKSIEMSMLDYLSLIKLMNLSKLRSRQLLDKASDFETNIYGGLSQTLLYLGQAVLPQAF